MDKKTLIENLNHLIEFIEKDSVNVRGSTTNMNFGDVSGVDPDDYQFQTHHYNGEINIDIEIELYDEDRDKSDEAYDPMDDIRKEIE